MRTLFLSLFSAAIVLAIGQSDPFHRPASLAGRSLITLSLFPEVQKELKTSPGFGTQVEALTQKMAVEDQQKMAGMANDMGAILDLIEKTSAKYDDQVLKLLTPQQAQRLGGLLVQFNGASAVLNPHIASSLNLSQDQTKRLEAVHADSIKKTIEAFQAAGGNHSGRQAMTKIYTQLSQSIEDILTPQQKLKLKEIEGPAIEFKKVTPPGG